MNIEIAEPGRMMQTGSSLLKLIQNNNMPVLDLFVRESIQNSLDAKNDKDSYVTVNFLTGKFNRKKLNTELEGVSCALNKKYMKNEYKYIAVKDSNTVGLTGPLHYDAVTDNNYGNLLKLIYEISKPQEAEGAGGSWGLGKTVYFRIGIGLVLYYSRIINENGNYESRLAASLVEDEIKDDALIPPLNKKTKRGIAWWGEKIGENKTQPVTDEQYIHNILKIFGIEPYTGNSTGTMIIIPYIDEEKLLKSNQIEYHYNEENIVQLFWQKSVEDYLRIAVQRWYAPRLSNDKYPYGKYLRTAINGVPITQTGMEPVFKVVQSLYNRAIGCDCKSDILYNSLITTGVTDISIRKVLETTKAGTIAYVKVSKDLLKMNYPDNNPNPYMYVNCEIRDKGKNKPLLFFTRKPGMIVSYENSGYWCDGIDSTNPDEYIMAIFVLNSDNKLTGNNINLSLEEYIRKSEMADHTTWSDYNIGNCNPRIVSKVQSQVSSKISKEFSSDEEDATSKINSGLGKMFGDLLLPPENFGKKPSSGVSAGRKTNTYSEKHKNVSLILDSIKYTESGVEIQVNIKTSGKINSTGIMMAIDSETGKISVREWENKMGLDMPFEIESCDIVFLKIDDNSDKNLVVLNYENKVKNVNDISCKMKFSDNGVCYAVHFESENRHNMEISLNLNLTLNRKDIKPLLMLEKNEGDE